MRSPSKGKTRTVLCIGLTILLGNFSFAQSFLPGERVPDYRPIGALVFTPDDSPIEDDRTKAAIHASYMFYISELQRALLGNNPQAIAQQAMPLEISPDDVERLYTLLNGFNTRSSSARRAMLEQECAPLLAGEPLTNLAAKEVAARINSDEPRDEILQSVLQETGAAFGDDVVQRIQMRIAEISRSPQFSRLEMVKETVNSQGVDYLAYLNEQCAAL